MDEQTTTPPPPPETPKTPEQADIAENKDLAALSYVWILALVVHFSAHHSPFAKFHCRQGLVLFALSIVGAMLPGLGTLLLLVVLALSVLGFLNAAQGLKKDLPVIGPLSRADLHGLQKNMHDLLEKIRSLWRKSKKASPADQKPTTLPTPSAPPQSPVSAADHPPSPPVS